MSAEPCLPLTSNAEMPITRETTIGFASVFRLRVRSDLPESSFIARNAVVTSSGKGFFPATCMTNGRGDSRAPEVAESGGRAAFDEDFGNFAGGRFSEMRVAAGRVSWSG